MMVEQAIDHAILDGREVVGCDSLMEWAAWFETASRTGGRIVAKTDVFDDHISTVFLALDHGWWGEPMWFETLVFPDQELMWRYGSYDEAEASHEIIVAHYERALLFRSRFAQLVLLVVLSWMLLSISLAY